MAEVGASYNTSCFLGAIVGLVATGLIRDLMGSFAAGLFAASALCLVGVVTALALQPVSRRASGPSLAAR